MKKSALPIRLQQLGLLSANRVTTGACICRMEGRAFHARLLPIVLHAVHLSLGLTGLRGRGVTGRASDFEIARQLTG